MRALRLFLTLFVMACCGNAASADNLDGWVMFTSIDSSAFRSVASATYYNDLNAPGSAALTGEHRVMQGSPAISFVSPVQGNGTYYDVLEGPTQPSSCYDTSLHVISAPAGISMTKYDKTWVGTTRCAPAPDGGGTGGGGPIGPGDDGGGPGTQLECIPGVDPGCGITSPIVINLDNGPYELTGTESPVLFDIAGTGTKLTIGWTAPGTNQAFLWMDRNHDGVVTGGAELFGTATVLKNGHRAPNGFEALREFDANADGVINASDPVWPQLLLWTDRNHDGISQPSEITRLADSPVRSISLAYHWTGRRDEHGNTFRYEGITSLSTGGKGSREQPVYDIFFVLGISGRTIP